jgi:hypothetical protein
VFRDVGLSVIPTAIARHQVQVFEHLRPFVFGLNELDIRFNWRGSEHGVYLLLFV